ncbi:hypothetical protein DFQ26_001478 [Actinomortierella ambigua]|nr:hypothetical protein DFQ26_001478 [Actinomortierella ambigua]
MASTGDDIESLSLDLNTRPGSLSPSPTPQPPHASSTSGSAAASSVVRSGSRGPIGPKPGVFRPCARCRQKKTKCDRIKPTCSNCKKGGADILCVYDNDEPTDGVLTSLPPDYAQTEPLGASTLPPTASIPKGSRRPVAASSLSTPSSRSPSTPPPTPTTPPAPTTGALASAETDALRIPSGSDAEKSSSEQQPPVATGTTPSGGRVRRGKATGATSAAIKPSPLRTSSLATDTAHSPSPTSPVDTNTLSEKQQNRAPPTEPQHVAQKPSKRSSKKAPEEVVSGLSIKEQETDDVGPRKDDDAASDTATPAPTTLLIPSKSRTSASASGSINGSGHHARAAGGGNNNSSSTSGGSKIVADLAAAAARAPPLPPPLTIDASQRARKWGRPRVMFRTLGGEVDLPLWISDQDMLLNDPKQTIYVDHEQLIQQHQKERSLNSSTSAGGGNGAGSGAGGRGGASGSRLAALKHLDHHHPHHHHRHRTATPDRGNTPESNESTPAPTPAPKRRRGRKQHHTSIDSSVRSLVESDIEMLGGDGGDEAEGTGDEVEEYWKKAMGLEHQEEFEGLEQDPPKKKAPKPHERHSKAHHHDRAHRHERRHGTDDFECGIDGCMKMYSSISTMRRHQSMVHKRRQPPIVRAREGAIPFTASAVLRKRGHHSATGTTTDDGGCDSSAAIHDDEDDEDDDDDDDDDDEDGDDEEDDEDDDDEDDEDDEEEFEEEAMVGDDDDQGQADGDDEGDGSTTAGGSPRRPTPYSAGSTAPSSPLHERKNSSNVASGSSYGSGSSSKMSHLLNPPEPLPPTSRRPLLSSDAGDDDAMAVDPHDPSLAFSSSRPHPSEPDMPMDRD